MYIVKCVPISKTIPLETLTYFSSNKLECNTIVKIMVRKKQYYAVTIESVPASEQKGELKRNSFSLRKIGGVSHQAIFSPSFLAAVSDTARYYCVSEGNILSQVLPKVALEAPEQYLRKQHEEFRVDYEPLVMQMNDSDRVQHYKSLIREEFAAGHSVTIICSTIDDTASLKESLCKGIEDFVTVLHGNMDKKSLKSSLSKIYEEKHPILTIATPKWLFASRADLGTIVLDKENSSFWRTQSRPYIDYRVFAEKLASQKKIRLIFADSILRIESVHREKKHEVGRWKHIEWHKGTSVETKITDLRPKDTTRERYSPISAELHALIAETIERRSRIFIFVARKGHRSVNICTDCGAFVTCDDCDSPVILEKHDGVGIFKCNQCNTRRSASELCKNCHGWRLSGLGTGIGEVVETLSGIYGGERIMELHKDKVASREEANVVVSNFYSSRGVVLVGTELALNHLKEKIDSTAVASLDSLFEIPDFRIKEKIFGIILRTRELAERKCLIQTRNALDKTVIQAISGNTLAFYSSEMAERKILDYPPLCHFAKITLRGNKERVLSDVAMIETRLAKYDKATFSSIYEKRGEKFAMNIVLKIKDTEWPMERSLDLPPQAELKLDPDNLL